MSRAWHKPFAIAFVAIAGCQLPNAYYFEYGMRLASPTVLWVCVWYSIINYNYRRAERIQRDAGACCDLAVIHKTSASFHNVPIRRSYISASMKKGIFQFEPGKWVAALYWIRCVIFGCRVYYMCIVAWVLRAWNANAIHSPHGHPVVIRCAKSGCDSSSTKIDYKRVQFERVCTLFIYTHRSSAHRTRCQIVHTLFISRLSTLYARYVSVFAGNPFFSMPFFHKSSFVYCALWCILCSLACSRVYFARIHFSSFFFFDFYSIVYCVILWLAHLPVKTWTEI